MLTILQNSNPTYDSFTLCNIAYITYDPDLYRIVSRICHRGVHINIKYDYFKT